MRRTARKLNLVDEREAFVEVPEPRGANNALSPQTRDGDCLSSQMPCKSQRREDPVGTRQDSGRVRDLLFPFPVQNEYDHALLTYDCEQQAPRSARTLSPVKTSVRRFGPSPGIRPAHISPPPVQTGSAVCWRPRVDREGLQRIVEGIAASRLAIRRAEGLAARASSEVALAVEATSRAASAMAELLGLFSQQLFENSSVWSEGQPSFAHLLSRNAEDTIGPGAPAVASVATATVASDDEEGTSSSEKENFSPLAVRCFRTYSHPPLGQSPLPSPSHRSTSCDSHAELQISSRNRRILSSATQPLNSSSLYKHWGFVSSESLRTHEATSLDTSDLQDFLRLYRQCREEQQKQLWPLRFSDNRRCQHVGLGPRLDPPNMGSPSLRFARLATWGTRTSATAASQCAARHEADESTVSHQNSKKRTLLMDRHSKTFCSGVSLTPKKQSRSFADDKLATVHYGAYSPLNTVLLERQAADSEYDPLADVRKARRRKNLSCATQKRTEGSETPAIQRRGLQATTHDVPSSCALTCSESGPCSPFREKRGDQAADTEAAHFLDGRGAEHNLTDNNKGELIAERKAETTETCSQDAKHGHSAVDDQSFVAAPRYMTCSPVPLAQQHYTVARDKLKSQGNWQTEEKARQNKRAMRRASDAREKKLARTDCVEGNPETLILAENMQHTRSHHDVRHFGDDRGHVTVSLLSTVELRHNSSSTPRRSSLRRRLYNSAARGVSTLLSRTSTHPGEDACQPRSSEGNCAGYSSCEGAPLHTTLPRESQAIPREDRLSQPHGGGLPVFTGNQAVLTELQKAHAQRHHLPSMKRNSSHTQNHTAEEKTDTLLEAHIDENHQRRAVVYVPEAPQRASSELKPVSAVGGFRQNERTDHNLCATTPRCGSGSRGTNTDQGRLEEPYRGVLPFSDKLKPHRVLRKDYRVAGVRHHALEEREFGDLQQGQLNQAHRDSSTFQRHSRNSAPASLQETVGPPSPLVASNRETEAHFLPIVPQPFRQVEEEGVATGQEASRAPEATARRELRINPLEDTKVGTACEISEQQVAGGLPVAAVKRESLQGAGGTRLHLLHTASFEGSGHLTACGSHFRSVPVGQSGVFVHVREVTCTTPIEILALENGSTRRGNEEGKTRDAGIRRRNTITERCSHGKEITTVSQITHGPRCYGPPPAGRRSRNASTSDSARSRGKRAVKQDATHGPNNENASQHSLVAEEFSHDDMEVSEATRTEEDLALGERRRECSSLQQFLLCSPRKPPDGFLHYACNSDVKPINFDGTRSRHRRSGVESTKRAESLDRKGGLALPADIRTAKVEEKDCKFTSSVPGVSYRAAPHSGWRFRWKDHENGKEYSRCFSVNKFGFQEAKRQAESVAMDIRGSLPARRTRRWTPRTDEPNELNMEAGTPAF